MGKLWQATSLGQSQNRNKTDRTKKKVCENLSRKKKKLGLGNGGDVSTLAGTKKKSCKKVGAVSHREVDGPATANMGA